MRLDVPVIRHKTDVLIIGGGAAGTMAAFECAEAGVDVIQVTKGRATSGTTTVARGASPPPWARTTARNCIFTTS